MWKLSARPADARTDRAVPVVLCYNRAYCRVRANRRDSRRKQPVFDWFRVRAPLDATGLALEMPTALGADFDAKSRKGLRVRVCC